MSQNLFTQLSPTLKGGATQTKTSCAVCKYQGGHRIGLRISSLLGIVAISCLIALPVFSQTNRAGSNSNVSIDLNTGSTTIVISPDGKQVMTPVGTVTSEAGFTVTPDGAMIAQDGTTINSDGSIITPNGVTILPNGDIIRPGQNNKPK
jgi:hypothetical protein